MSLFSELKRRNVIRVVTAYIVTAWVVVQVAETLFPVFGLSDQSIRNTVIIAAIGIVRTVRLASYRQLYSRGYSSLRQMACSATPAISRPMPRRRACSIGWSSRFSRWASFIWQ
jgi:hypothetical protein